MRCKTLVLALTVGFGPLAAAQPGPPAPPPGPPDTGTGTTGTVETTTTPAPPPPAPPPPPPPVERTTAEPPADVRPGELAFAIGIGYQLPTSLETPNVTSVRLRLPSGLTFEPRVSIANESHTVEMTGGTKTTETTTELGLATLVRLPVIRHGRVDFEVLGSVGLDTTKLNPDGDNNDTTTTKLSLGWGIGIGYWFSPHWQLSFDATNPLISYTSTKQETGVDMSMTDSRTTVGVIFSPVVSMMIHIYN